MIVATGFAINSLRYQNGLCYPDALFEPDLVTWLAILSTSFYLRQMLFWSVDTQK